MNRKYSLKQFVLGVIICFFIFHFYLFIPGAILCLIGIRIKVCLQIGLALFVIDLILSVMEQMRIRSEISSDSDNPEFNELMDAYCDPNDTDAFKEMIEEKIRAETEESQARQDILQKLIVYRTLNDSIHNGMTLEEMINSFAEMCRISVGDPDGLLFETGNYNFNGKKLFCFSLVRQFQFLSGDEYVQLRLDVTYTPSIKTALCRTIKWDSLIDGDFFEMVKTSRSFRLAKELPIVGVSVSVEET